MIGAETVLTPRELNRAVLARQLLLERRRLSVPTFAIDGTVAGFGKLARPVRAELEEEARGLVELHA